MTVLVNALGSLGAAALLMAYALLQRGHVRAGNPVYLVLNLLGSVGLAGASAAVGAWPSTGLNLVWLFVGITAVLRPPPRLEASDQAVRSDQPPRRCTTVQRS